MKSVLHVALIGPAGYSNKGLMDGFLQAGFDTYHCFDFQLKTFEFGKEAMRRMLIEEAEQLKPDLVFCQIQGSDIVDHETFKKLSRIAFTVNYTFDIRSKEQTHWLHALAGVIGLVCFSNQEDVEECKRWGYKNSMVLQSSADPEVYKPGEGIERKGIVFIGNNFVNTNIEFPLSRERVEMVEFLQKEFPDQFKVYGNNWPGSKLVMQKEEVEILQSAAIVINQNNFDAELYVSDRIWRTMMCGAFCLTKYFDGVEELFKKDQLGWWRDLDSLKGKIQYYLTKPERTALRAEYGRQYVLENHTWAARVKEMMAFIQDNLMDMRTYTLDMSTEGDPCLRAGAHVIGGVIPQPFDEHLAGKPCDCNRLIGRWTECGCAMKEYQFRWEENI